MKDSRLQGVSANGYQLQSNNLIKCTVDSLPILAKSCTDLNQYRRENMKDEFHPSLCKLANNVPAGSALLFEHHLAGCIKSLNNTTSLMKPDTIISNQEVFGKNPKKLPALLKKLCLMKERELSLEQLNVLQLETSIPPVSMKIYTLWHF